MLKNDPCPGKVRNVSSVLVCFRATLPELSGLQRDPGQVPPAVSPGHPTIETTVEK